MRQVVFLLLCLFASLEGVSAPLMNPNRTGLYQVTPENKAILDKEEQATRIEEILWHQQLRMILGIVVLVLVSLLILFRRWIINRLIAWKREIFKPPDPKQVALKALERLKKEEWQKRSPQQRAQYLTDLIKKYVEKRHHLDAQPMTTEEFLASLKSHPEMSVESSKILDEVLQTLDLMKFANYVPSQQEYSHTLSQTKKFLES